MALKQKITAAEHAALSDGLKSAYIADGDGFKLDVEVDDKPPAPDAAAAAKIADLEAQLAAAKKPKPPATDAARLQRLEDELASERKARRDERFNRIVNDAVAKAGFRPEAIEDVVGRVQRAGLSLQEDGETVAATAEGQETVTLSDHLKLIRKSAPHLHAPPKGAPDRFGAPPKAPPKTVLRDATPEEFARNAPAIAKGEMAVEWAER